MNFRYTHGMQPDWLNMLQTCSVPLTAHLPSLTQLQKVPPKSTVCNELLPSLSRQGGASSASTDPLLLLGGTSGGQSEAALTAQGSDTDEGTDAEDTMSESGRSDRSQGDSAWQQTAHRRMSRLSRQGVCACLSCPYHLSEPV